MAGRSRICAWRPRRLATRHPASGARQTRKWTDQHGVERYTTEVVLQNFRGELTLLDRAGGGGAAEGRDQGGDEFGAGTTAAAGRDSQPATSGPLRDQLDDDIPF